MKWLTFLLYLTCATSLGVAQGIGEVIDPYPDEKEVDFPGNFSDDIIVQPEAEDFILTLPDDASEEYGREEFFEYQEYEQSELQQEEYNDQFIEEQLILEKGGALKDTYLDGFRQEEMKGIFEAPDEEAIEMFLQEDFIEATPFGLSIIIEEEERTTLRYDEAEDDTIVRGPSQYDDRLEIRQLNPIFPWQARVLHTNESVGMIVERDYLSQVTDSLYQIDHSVKLGQLYRLCPGEAFAEQPVSGVGTAFILPNGQMATADHVFERPLEDYAVVFGYETVNALGTVDAFIPIRDVYFPQRTLIRDGELDVAIFEVDRPLRRKGLPLRTTRDMPLREPIYMVGHPNGLPTKAAINARTLSEEFHYLYTSLDAFQGNSGSPVCHFQTGEVIGILVAGNRDYEWTGSCNRVATCRYPYCDGEKVLRIDAVIKALEGL